MKIKTVLALLAVVAFINAANTSLTDSEIANSSGLSYVLINDSCVIINSDALNASNLVICANAPVEYINNTIYVNQTVYVNVTEYQCNATTTTLWANSSAVINNQTFICLSNVSTVFVNQTIYQNISVPFCNFTGDIQPSGSDQHFQNVSGMDFFVRAIPPSYCYENININPATFSQIVRSDKCNITVISPTATVCTTCQVCPTCAVCTACSVIDKSIILDNNTPIFENADQKLRVECMSQNNSYFNTTGIDNATYQGVLSTNEQLKTQGFTCNSDLKSCNDSRQGNIDSWNSMAQVLSVVVIGVCLVYIVSWYQRKKSKGE